MVSRRQERVAELLREELSILVSTELTDPRLEDAMLSVTDVVVSADLRSARVYVEHTLPESASPRVLAALQNSVHFLRKALVANLSLRYVPELFFQVDMTERRARRIDELLDAIDAEAHRGPVEDGGAVVE